jgi:hypothetical protein
MYSSIITNSKILPQSERQLIDGAHKSDDPVSKSTENN